MATWATKRKYGYFFGLIFVLFLIVGVPTFFTFYEAPTCEDGERNGGERGIDCGGKCSRLCALDFIPPKILWSYTSKVVGSVYNALAYVQNPNLGVEANNVPYIFRMYDKDGLLVAQKAGRTFVPAGQKFAVFEGGINAGARVPVRTTFEFPEVPEWRPGEVVSKIKALSIQVVEGNSPAAEVKIKNESIDRAYSNIDAFIVLYDASDNRIAFSKTVIENIVPGGSDTIYFTWPLPLDRPVVRKEAIFVVRPRN